MFTTTNDLRVLVMDLLETAVDLLEASTLARYLSRKGRLSIAEMADIMVQVVSDTGAKHARGDVHGDLKPANIILLEDGVGPPRARVLDARIAHLADSRGGTLGRIAAAPAYKAPEQWRARTDVDHRADMWAIGAMIYELLSGRRPIEGDSISEVAESLRTDGVLPLKALVPDVPFDLAVMARRLLEREPRSRPADLRDVLAVLAKYARVEASTFGAVGSQSTEVRIP